MADTTRMRTREMKGSTVMMFLMTLIVVVDKI